MRLFRKETTPELDVVIKKLENELKAYGPGDPEWDKAIVTMDRVLEIKDKRRSKVRVSPDTMAIVAGNLLGILILVGFEHSHAMTSKALTFVMRPKTPDF